MKNTSDIEYLESSSPTLNNMKFSVEDFTKFYTGISVYSQLSDLYNVLSERANKKSEEDFNKINEIYYS